MNTQHYIGLDVHKKWIWFCEKTSDGDQVCEGRFEASREAIEEWCLSRGAPWTGLMEATLFSHWIYYQFARHAEEIRMGHAAAMKEMLLAKHKNDLNDARRFAELCRLDLVPTVEVIPANLHPLRQQLRTRQLIQRQIVQIKNRTSTLLMECGIAYKSRQLHTERYYQELIKDRQIPKPVRALLNLLHGAYKQLASIQKAILDGLAKSPELEQRVQLLETIPAVGRITALTWALEVGNVERFTSLSRAVSYCGLVSAQNESAGKNKPGPLSKVRNRLLQSVLIEVGHVAWQWYWKYDELYQKTAQQHNHNVAAIAVARKMVAYLLAIDRSGKPFQKLDPLVAPGATPSAEAAPVSARPGAKTGARKRRGETAPRRPPTARASPNGPRRQGSAPAAPAGSPWTPPGRSAELSTKAAT